jgi:16S rRNA (guanine527-N7)-methyltransferase
VDEEQAKAWLSETFNVSRETLERLGCFEALLAEENRRHNLVSAASLSTFWSRHVADSAQLLLHRPSPGATWLDLGTGAGFPGLIVAAMHAGPVTLVEERRLRVEFLHRAAEALGVVEKTEIVGSRVERFPPRPFDVISARAFAPLDKLLALGAPFSTAKTRWILPKGRNAQLELEAAESSWQGDFRLEPSLTDPEARIIVAEGVRPRGKGNHS